MKKGFILYLLCFLFVLNGLAQSPVSWSISSKQIEGDLYELKIEAEIDEGWHLYSQNLDEDKEGPLPTFITYEIGDNFKLEGVSEELGVIKHFDKVWGYEISYFDKRAVFIQKVTKAYKDTQMTLKGNVEFMVCNDQECMPPDYYDFEIDVETGKSVQEAVEYKTDSAALAVIPNLELLDLTAPINQDCGDAEEQNKSFWLLFLLGLGGGLISLITPCVFPMIPLTVSFFTKGGNEKGSGIAKALLYGVSIVLVYVSLSLPFYAAGTDPEVLNQIASGAVLNVFFFLIFMFFAFSFFGYYELTLPSSWANKADQASSIGGILGVVFMALVLAIVSFSCTGPLLGSVLAGSLNEGPVPITMAMLGFGVGLGLPFALFAAFPMLLQSMPQSGGWLNSVKVVLGFVEVALAFKFLSTADLVEHWGILKYETFLVIWILCAIGTALYLFGIIRFPHDSPSLKLKLPRIAIASVFAITAVYLSFGFRLNEETHTYQSLNLLSGVAPPVTYCYFYPNDCPNGLNCFHDLESAQSYAVKEAKPLLLDFTGYACTNCRRMEDNVWSQQEVFDLINDHFVLASLYVDDRKELPKENQGEITIQLNDSTKKLKKIITVGDKWATFEQLKFGKVSQPHYVLISEYGELLTNPVSYTPDPKEYANWLRCGLDAYQKLKNKEH